MYFLKDITRFVAMFCRHAMVSFEDQRYSDDRGEWSVPDIVDYATENGKKMPFSV